MQACLFTGTAGLLFCVVFWLLSSVTWIPDLQPPVQAALITASAVLTAAIIAWRGVKSTVNQNRKNHEASTALSLRKDVYLEAAAAITGAAYLSTSLHNPEVKLIHSNDAIQSLLRSVGKVHTLGDEQTVAQVHKFMQVWGRIWSDSVTRKVESLIRSAELDAATEPFLAEFTAKRYEQRERQFDDIEAAGRSSLELSVATAHLLLHFRRELGVVTDAERFLSILEEGRDAAFAAALVTVEKMRRIARGGTPS